MRVSVRAGAVHLLGGAVMLGWLVVYDKAAVIALQGLTAAASDPAVEPCHWGADRGEGALLWQAWLILENGLENQFITQSFQPGKVPQNDPARLLLKLLDFAQW